MIFELLLKQLTSYLPIKKFESVLHMTNTQVFLDFWPMFCMVKLSVYQPHCHHYILDITLSEFLNDLNEAEFQC